MMHWLEIAIHHFRCKKSLVKAEILFPQEKLEELFIEITYITIFKCKYIH